MMEQRARARETPDSVRHPHIALNVLGQCHSSACVELGGTRVVCAVRHPQQLVDEYRGDRGRVACTVTMPARAHVSSLVPERDMALALEGVAERAVVLAAIPQLLVEVAVDVVAEDGGVWDAAATSLSAALVAGGFEMYDVVTACSAALMHDGTVVTDPDAAEEAQAAASALVCTMLGSGDMCFATHRGSCETGTVSELIMAAMKGCMSRKSAITEQLKDQSILL